jgi:hypothetical protein
MEPRSVATVRESAGKSTPPLAGPCVRVNIRIDLYPYTGRVDYSVIAWQHPHSRVIVNELVTNVGPLEHDVVVSDLGAAIAALIDSTFDPFPP